MLNSEFDPAHLRESVFAVPPLARNANGEVCRDENLKIIRFLEDGGVRSLLYGGNALFYHIRLSEFASTLSVLAESTSDETTVVPSIGPAYGLACDQVDVLREFPFATAMLLPSRDVIDQAGCASGVRRLAERLGKPLVLYLKFDQWLDPSLVESLEKDGVISWIKYAVVRDDPADDSYLRSIIDVFPTERIVSGIGEQPAIVHLRDFGITGFTSGCVCVAPARSMEMMHAIHDQQFDEAESIREWFLPLEDLRNQYSPIRVLHHAVEAAGVAKTGSMLPMVSDLDANVIEEIHAAVAKMR
ncbi:dihydrodipicolinate synthase family protein [Rhodopirellula sp. MGV]|uniref:dihydrodipicolinate synthase family protein n=1 Tax=Rhodopirellula sp. MGV TaxID=2023130 RepID=UPI000B96E51A|nr:dihydrodipicolinate synthase family protein [Rhodopirellula sp. MGV]OYP38930.1 dihydrodipicolinate synthase family protein [Rhodopirellula sp. MGV]PNY37607.1 dihydrodipicolinate synthase family protein [Rhodopirellula baltica]